MSKQQEQYSLPVKYVWSITAILFAIVAVIVAFWIFAGDDSEIIETPLELSTQTDTGIILRGLSTQIVPEATPLQIQQTTQLPQADQGSLPDTTQNQAQPFQESALTPNTQSVPTQAVQPYVLQGTLPEKAQSVTNVLNGVLR